MDIFCFNFGAAVAKIFNKYKKISPDKKFLETLSVVLPAKTKVGLRELWFWREEQNSEFPKTFCWGYLFVGVEYLCNRSLKIKTKNAKNYSLILAVINHRNWLDDLPPLSVTRSTNRTVTSDTKNFTLEYFLTDLALGLNKLNEINSAQIDCFTNNFINTFHEVLHKHATLRYRT